MKTALNHKSHRNWLQARSAEISQVQPSATRGMEIAVIGRSIRDKMQQYRAECLYRLGETGGYLHQLSDFKSVGEPQADANDDLFATLETQQCIAAEVRETWEAAVRTSAGSPIRSDRDVMTVPREAGTGSMLESA